MINLNQAIIGGRVVREVEFKNINENQLAKFSIATNRNWKDKQGEWQSEPTYHNIVVWGKQAELCHKRLNKGSEVYVEGVICNDKYTDKMGVEKKFTSIKAKSIQFLDFKPEKKITKEVVNNVANFKPEVSADFTHDDIPF